MKTKTPQTLTLIAKIRKSVIASFKSILESQEKRDFQRLKDFIAS